MMNWIGFLFFLMLALCYLWNGKDTFNNKEWISFGLKFLAVILGVFIFGFIFKFFATVVPVISVTTAKYLTVTLFLSFTMILGTKFLVVMICAIFSRIIAFHRDHNKDHYQEIASISNRYGSSLILLAKCLISFGSVLIFYGIWLA